MVSEENIKTAVYTLPLPQELPVDAEIKGRESSLPESLLVRNALWFCRVRWLVIATLVCYGILGLFPRSISYFEIRSPGVWPFVLAMLACITIITIFPQIALFLPSLM